MYFQDEILPRNEVAPPKQQLASTELDMAVSLVNTMAMSFKPAEYKDEYVIALKKVVEAKVRGIEIKIPKPLKIEPIDLMSALKISIENAKKESQTREKVGAARGTR
jgi:DNA end-binding protein Ku